MKDAKKAVAEAGRELLREGLVARTWGNVSCRTGKDAFVITPSGLAYDDMSAEDIVSFSMLEGSWTGTRKPSSEKGIHAAAYTAFPEAGFVINTHQKYASALSLAGFEGSSLTDEERDKLGGIALAAYGLPGTKKLCVAVEQSLCSGAHTVLMAHHGCLLVGRDENEAFERARLLEEVCKRACRGQIEAPEGNAAAIATLYQMPENAGKLRAVTTACVRAVADAGKAVYAQLDDMAQMIGAKLKVADGASAQSILMKQGAVLIPGLGCVCRAETEGDLDALCLLSEKACIAYLHTRECGRAARLSPLDAQLMRFVYKKKYAKKIGG